MFNVDQKQTQNYEKPSKDNELFFNDLINYVGLNDKGYVDRLEENEVTNQFSLQNNNDIEGSVREVRKQVELPQEQMFARKSYRLQGLQQRLLQMPQQHLQSLKLRQQSPQQQLPLPYHSQQKFPLIQQQRPQFPRQQRKSNIEDTSFLKENASYWNTIKRNAAEYNLLLSSQNTN